MTRDALFFTIGGMVGGVVGFWTAFGIAMVVG